MTSQRPKPNLFKYGRKELSQDAMICWLLAWANECYADTCPALHKAGQNFAKALFGKHGGTEPSEGICTVKLEQQASGIDVLAWINDECALLIEDKTDSNGHSGQLERYHELVLGGDACVEGECIKPSKDRLFPIFLKTGNMSRADKNAVESRDLDPPYRVFERKDFLCALEDHKQDVSEILTDFFNHLQEREEDSTSWKDTPPADWSWGAWEGFYRCLEEKIGSHIETDSITDIKWGYIPNQAGGFLEFWRYYYDAVSGDAVYWQAEYYWQDKRKNLCFKISVGDDGNRGERRWHWHERIMKAGESEGMSLIKPRFGSGEAMTVAILEGDDWRQSGSDGRLDLEKTVEVLKKAERVLQAAVASARADGPPATPS